MLHTWRNRKWKKQDATAQKIKAVSDEVDLLKTDKQKLETDQQSLLAAANDYAEKAECSHQLSELTNSEVKFDEEGS